MLVAACLVNAAIYPLIPALQNRRMQGGKPITHQGNGNYDKWFYTGSYLYRGIFRLRVEALL
jgi:hypothetical protein